MYVDATDADRVASSSPRTIRASRASAASSARRASTNCRSSSTWCSRAICRSSARARTRSTPRPKRGSMTKRSTAISRAIASSPASPAGRRSTAGAARPTPQEKIQKRVEYDLYYIENWSVLFDLYIVRDDAVRAAQDRERVLNGARVSRFSSDPIVKQPRSFASKLPPVSRAMSRGSFPSSPSICSRAKARSAFRSHKRERSAVKAQWY